MTEMTDWEDKRLKRIKNYLHGYGISFDNIHATAEFILRDEKQEMKKAFDEVEIDCPECGGQASNIDKIKFKRGINNDN